jgi:hypothetical protein
MVFRAIALTTLLGIAALLLAAQEKGPSRVLPPSEGAPQVGEKVGVKVPDFTLPDIHGNPVALSEFIANGEDNKPGWVLLIFYRGYW